MPWLPIAAAAAAPLLGGIAGQIFSSGDQDKAKQAQADALAAIQGLSPPELASLQADFQKYQQTGEMSPSLQSIIQEKPSELSSISTDPRLKQAQMGALQKLQQLGSGGLQPQDLAALAKVQQQAAAQGQAQQQSALQAMQQRGIGGGGSELAARLSAAQGSANNSMQGGLDIQGQAAQRALQAIAQSGQLGGQIQAQDFSQQAQQATAQDAINRFNAMNSQQVQGQNVAAQNAAKYYNLGQKQEIANKNTDVANQQNLQHIGAVQQNYSNKAGKASGLSNALNNSANQDLTRAGQTQQLFGGIGQGLGQAAAGAGTYQQNKLTADAAETRDNKWFNRLFPDKTTPND